MYTYVYRLTLCCTYFIYMYIYILMSLFLDNKQATIIYTDAYTRYRLYAGSY